MLPGMSGLTNHIYPQGRGSSQALLPEDRDPRGSSWPVPHPAHHLCPALQMVKALALPAWCPSAARRSLWHSGTLCVTGLQAAAVSLEVSWMQAQDLRTPASCMQRQNKWQHLLPWIWAAQAARVRASQACLLPEHGSLFSYLERGTDVSSKDTFKIKIIMQ